jgi:hypothetical protein
MMEETYSKEIAMYSLNIGIILVDFMVIIMNINNNKKK